MLSLAENRTRALRLTNACHTTGPREIITYSLTAEDIVSLSNLESFNQTVLISDISHDAEIRFYYFG